MFLTPVEWGLHLSQGLASDQAVAVFRVPELTLMWCNSEYASMLRDLYGCCPEVGRTLEEYSPVSNQTKGALLREVGSTGDPQAGEDLLFSVEDGVTSFRWSIHRPCTDHVVAVIERRGTHVNATCGTIEESTPSHSTAKPRRHLLDYSLL